MKYMNARLPKSSRVIWWFRFSQWKAIVKSRHPDCRKTSLDPGQLQLPGSNCQWVQKPISAISGHTYPNQKKNVPISGNRVDGWWWMWDVVRWFYILSRLYVVFGISRIRSSVVFTNLCQETTRCGGFRRCQEMSGVPVSLWLCQNSYWKWWFIVDLPIENGDFP